jgi:hypothetical protein
MTESIQTEVVQQRPSTWLKPWHKSVLIGLGGMFAGAFVSVGVEQGLQSTGLLGPGVESLIAEQEANFTSVSQQLETLRNLPADPEVKRSLAELGTLLDRQNELGRHANAELAWLGDQVSAMREQQLAEAGFAAGADFWLKSGESVTVGGPDQVFALLGARATIADVNVNGKRQRITVGDVIPMPGSKNCTVSYKLATPRGDGRVGFDVSCS